MEERAVPALDSESVQRAERYRRRKTTSVLAIVFTDIADSTRLREEMGEQEYEALREDFDRRFSGIVEADDAGAIVKGTGDGALVIFSEPSTAVERCLSVQRELGGHPHFRLRVGVDMGQVTVKLADGIPHDVFGRQVNRAARIQSLAEPGHILTSFHVFDCAVGWLRRDSIRWHNHGEAQLKGFERAISIHEIFDPGRVSPQSNRGFPVPPPATIEADEDVDLESAEPILQAGKPLSKDDWRLLHEAVVDASSPMIPPASVVAADPFGHYAARLEQLGGELGELLPERPAILWVDDQPGNNERERDALLRGGFAIDLARTTEEAISRLAARPYLLVITDLRRGSEAAAGLELLRRKSEREDRTPTLVYASSAALAAHGPAARAGGALLATAGVLTLLDGVASVLGAYRNLG